MSNASPVRVTAGVPTGGQFAPNSQAEADVVLEAPDPPKPRVPTDREVLDSIAIRMAASQNWDADLTDEIAREIARSGRPHPGDVLADEAELADERGEYVEDAAGQKYQQLLDQQRAEEEAVPRVDPIDTVALVNYSALKDRACSSDL